MHRIDHPTAVPSQPPAETAGHPGFFTSGSPMSELTATIVTADWANSVQEEISSVIEDAGISLDKTNNRQLLQALNAPISEPGRIPNLDASKITTGIFSIERIPTLPAIMPTFVVDSNQALSDWGWNAPGNDYSHVLIKRGTWSLAIGAQVRTYGIDLNRSGTKAVTGEPGSILAIEAVSGMTPSPSEFSAMRGLSSYPGGNDEFIEGVTINLTVSGYGGMEASAFKTLRNLIRCGASVVYSGVSYAGQSSLISGFWDCRNLRSCNAYASQIGAALDARVFGFSNCFVLDACVGGATTNNATALALACGFTNSMYMQSCIGNASCNSNASGASETAYGIALSSVLNGCYGTARNTTASTSSYAVGIADCDSLTCCVGTGIQQAAGAGRFGYGFSRCRTGFACRVGAPASTTATFNNCLMAQANLSPPTSNDWANTAAGGWNMS